MLAWFLTKNGRLFTQATVGVVTASIFGVQMSLHGPLLHKYKEILQMYQKNEPQPIPSDLLAMANEVLEKCDLEEKEKNRVSFFITPGMEICHGGGYNSPWGAIVGLPLIYSDKIGKVEGEVVLVGKHDFDWVVDGMDLMETLRLSPAAKKFAIARDIYTSNIWRVSENAAIGAFCFYFPAILGKYYNTRRNAYQYKLSKRLTVYSLLYGIGLMFYLCLRHPLKHITEIDADERAAKINREYLQGGLEFYQKVLQRNRELREIFGKAGESRFTAEGNQNYVFLAPKLPISKRLELLQKLEMKIY